MELLKSFILVLVFGIFIIHLVGAVADMSISVDDVFYEDDEVKFAYRFISTQDETIKYFANVNCPGSPESPLEMKVVNLIANEYFQEVYSYGFVDENVQSGDCVASVSILEPYQKSSEKLFKIETLGTFDFSLIFSKKVFLQNQEIYLDYSSSIDNPSIIATLIYPDGSTKSINLPTTIKAEQIGTYELEIEVSKQGYKDVSLKEQFGVIETEANIDFNQTFYSDDTSNLSTDFNEEEEDVKLFENKIFVYILIGLVVLLILLIVIFFIVKKKQNLSPSSELNMQRE